MKIATKTCCFLGLLVSAACADKAADEPANASATAGRGSQQPGLGAEAGAHAGTPASAGGVAQAAAGRGGGVPSADAATGGNRVGAPSAGSAGGATVAGVGGASGHGAAGGSAGSTPNAGTGGAAGTISTGCTPPPATPIVGWATVSGDTTGGGNASPTTVTTLAQLTAAVSGTDAAVVWVKGSITGVIKIGSNKTLIGVCGAELHGHVELDGSANVIIRNLKIVGYGVGNCALDPSYDASVGCSSGADAITVQKNANHIVFDHCDISDGTDGNLDITNGANYVTVSWTKFHYTPRTDSSGSDSTGAAGHRFSNLIGGTDSPKYDDANALNVTWHHNWWADGVVERQPRVRFGKNHLFNNLWSSSESGYCVRAGKQAQILIEQSVFTGVKNPQVFNSDADQGTAFITASNNVYTNTSGMMATDGGGTAFTKPPYSYTADPTSGLEAAIRSAAGPH